MYKCQYFNIYELVPKDFEPVLENKLWLLFDNRALITLDELRRKFGPVIVNNWKEEGPLSQCGFRTASGIGAAFSQHRYGRAFDCHFKNVTAEEVRQLCKQGQYNCFYHITAIEDKVSWFHFDIRNNSGPLLVFNS